MNALVHYK